DGVRYQTPGGTRGFRGNQAVQTGYLARVNGVDFEIVDRIW
ncbi:regulator, partial [Nocardia abscessus]|nr:regulator [Nocardia abscessus]